MTGHYTEQFNQGGTMFRNNALMVTNYRKIILTTHIKTIQFNGSHLS